MPRPARSPLASHWTLNPEVVFLNHGSFGACPRTVLEYQHEIRMLMEREPVRFMVRELEPALDASRAVLAAFLGARPEDLVFVPNATVGVNAVLRSLDFAPGDELLTTDHEYNACRNVLDYVAARSGARVIVASIPLPVGDEEQIIHAVLERVSPRTRLAMISRVTSPTAVIFPIERLVRALRERGIDTLVDDAHGPGMLPSALDALGAAYATGNCHKWMCAPKGAGYLHVRRDRHASVRPAIISHGANSQRTDRGRLWLEFDWTGTIDFSPYLCVAEAIRAVGAMVPGGWGEVMQRNRALATKGRSIVVNAMRAAGIDIAPTAPDPMCGSIAALTLPDPPRAADHGDHDPLKLALESEGIQVPVVVWPAPGKRLLRLSAHLHNSEPEYEFLADRLVAALRDERAAGAGHGPPTSA